MSETATLTIVRCSADRLIDLRHAVLRKGMPRETAIFPGDESETAIHIAATLGHEVVGCSSFHLNEWNGQPAYQLRGMATAESARRRGVGRAMLNFADSVLRKTGKSNQLWCNARLIAVPFYQSLGWVIVSDLFDIPTAGPHHRMTRTIPAK